MINPAVARLRHWAPNEVSRFSAANGVGQGRPSDRAFGEFWPNAMGENGTSGWICGTGGSPVDLCAFERVFWSKESMVVP